ncbi:unnamed protein product [Sphagnum jensenii]|uniref:Sulfite exporter TauE/SafE family protein n=1 Tax=Sphagnum jensenii TaxID=128206 RepID=A0ABP1AJ75_9BRYO
MIVASGGRDFCRFQWRYISMALVIFLSLAYPGGAVSSSVEELLSSSSSAACELSASAVRIKELRGKGAGAVVCSSSSRRNRSAERDEEEQQQEEEELEVEDDVRGNIGNVSDARSVVDDEANYGATLMRLPHGEVVADFVTREDVDPDSSGYRKNWPKFEPGWRLAIGTVLGSLGAAVGSVGGVGGGGFFIPILTLIIGFDTKTTTALSKSMIMGAALAAVIYNLKRSHPTTNVPLIDYEMALLFQPMMILGISIGVAFNIIFPDWLITLLLVLLCTSTHSIPNKSFLWIDEVCPEKSWLHLDSAQEVEYMALPAETCQPTFEPTCQPAVSGPPTLQGKFQWKYVGLLSFVWLVFLLLQILKNGVHTCSLQYWAINLVQIPIALGVTGFQELHLYRKSQIASITHTEADLDYKLTDSNWGVGKLALYAGSGVLAGTMGGLLGVGGGSIIGGFLLELGVPPQVSSATATFLMLFSSSMSVVEYSLLGRLPRDHAIFLTTMAAIGAFWGQSVVQQFVVRSGKASIIIFMLAVSVTFSVIVLGVQGSIRVYGEWQDGAYMGFEDLCR